MDTDDLHWLEITELAKLIQLRRVSPVEVVEAMLRRIERLDRRLHAFVRTTPELALEQARHAEARIARREYLGPLHGVPIAFKDLNWTRGIPTGAGMPIHRDWVPPHDGTVVERLRIAGAVTLGKLQMTEGAFADHHPAVTVPLNPWHPDHWVGASSSGTGSAVAAGLCFGATGSDTGGSIRFPCTANGVTGIKPTWGRVSRFGAYELAATLDHIGPMARSAADCGLLLGAMAGADPNDPTASQQPVPDYLGGDERSLAGVVIGIDDAYVAPVEPVVAEGLRAAADVLRRLGATIRPVTMPDVEPVIADWPVDCAVQTAVAHARTFPSRRADYGPGLAGLLDLATTVSGIDYQRVLLRRADFTGRMHALFREVDLLLMPGQVWASPTVAEMARLGQDPTQFSALVRFTAPFDSSGHPAITMPSGFTAAGLPVSIQLATAHFREDLLVRAGRAFQRETDWHRRHPRT
jgi:amidase